MNKEFLTINLNDLLNHQLFSNSNNPNLLSSYNCSLSGSYFKRNSIIEEDHEELVFVNEIPFVLNHSDSYFDNVACEAQKIKLSNQMCKRIYILGLAEHGDFRDEVRLTFKDGTIGIYKFILKDWRDLKVWNFDEIYGCYVAFEGKDNLNKRRFIYYCVIELDVIKNIKEMELPYNPNIHLISLTVEVVKK